MPTLRLMLLEIFVTGTPLYVEPGLLFIPLASVMACRLVAPVTQYGRPPPSLFTLVRGTTQGHAYCRMRQLLGTALPRGPLCAGVLIATITS